MEKVSTGLVAVKGCRQYEGKLAGSSTAQIKEAVMQRQLHQLSLFHRRQDG